MAKNIPYQWSEMFDLLHGYRPRLYYHIVKWSMSEEGWVKYNTDGASKGNPRVSSYGFCIRDSNGYILYAEARNIGITTNMEEEITAVWKAVRHCKNQGLNHIKLEADSLSHKLDSEELEDTLEYNGKN